MANDVFHAKKALVLIKDVQGNYKSITFAKEVTITPTVQGVARTISLGSDLVSNVANHGLTFKARLSIYLTKQDSYWMNLLGDAFTKTVYDADRDVLANVDAGNSQLVVSTDEKSLNDMEDDKRWQVMGETELVILNLDGITKSLVNADTNDTFTLANLLNSNGMISVLKRAVLTEMDIKTRSTEFTELMLGVETGQAEFRVNDQTVNPITQFSTL